MPRRGHVLTALAQPGFRRLFAVRLAGQFGDGVFQASLAGAVLFSPERQAHAADVAAGFVVLLLPYSFLGPFAGVLLDRWWRQRVLVVANLLRVLGVLGVTIEIAGGLHGQPFYASGLVVLSVSRFLLSALSAALPHVVDAENLVTANALSTTSGAVATTVGGGAAIGVRLLVGASAHSYASMAVAAAVPYLLAALWARGFAREQLGPDAVERGNRETLAAVAHGLVAGARHLRSRRPALLALTVIGIHRVCFGIWTVCTLLLYRNSFTSDGLFRTGLTGIGQAVVVSAVGAGLAALVTPAASRRVGLVAWSAALLTGAGVVEVVFVLPYRLRLLLIAAMLLGFASQGIKICVDTAVQQYVADEFRGRVFALYDTLFNLALVVAAVLTALVLPDTGRSPGAVITVGAIYLATAAGYLCAAGPRSDQESSDARPVRACP